MSLDMTQKHPIGQIIQNIGPVDILENFYEYQLYCKNIFNSIQQFTKNTLQKRDKDEIASHIRFNYNIFSIDPSGSVDFDDAVSIKQLAPNEYILSIYISDVAIYLDKLNLWSSFSNRVSTIYLPNKKHTMLPTILSDNLCSLTEKEIRNAIIMDIYILNDSVREALPPIKPLGNKKNVEEA